MIDWFFWVFAAIKAFILGAGMFFAIKWHYDQEIKRGKKRHEMFGMASKLAAIFLISLLGLGFMTFSLINKLGM
jgi:heme/copper-type cytochrome/quinol oxidase subunit 2